MENVHLVYIIRYIYIYIYIYPFFVIIILRYSTIHVKYFKFDFGIRNKNKQGPYLIFLG